MAYQRISSSWPAQHGRPTVTDHELDDATDWHYATQRLSAPSTYSLQSAPSLNTQDDSPLIQGPVKPLPRQVTAEIRRRHWRPLSLRIWWLIFLFLFFTVLWTSLLIVWHFSRKEDGLRLTITSNHLAWKYGPTAILVIFVSFWRQVDYHCKSLQPWQNMIEGYASASNSMLLDYLWPLQLESWWVSIRNGHWRVAVSTTGFMILKFVMLVSTALIIATETTLSNNVPIQFTKALSDVPFPNIDPAPIQAYLGTLGGALIEPQGMQGSLLYRPFVLDSEDRPVSSITAEAEIFVPRVSCEVDAAMKYLNADQILSMDDYDESYAANISLAVPSCPVDPKPGNMTDAFYLNLLAAIYEECNDPTCTKLIQSHYQIDCLDPGYVDSYYYYNSSINHTDFRYAAVFANITITKSPSDNENDTDYISTIDDFSAVFCKFDYSLEVCNITRDQLTGAYTIDVPPGPGSGKHMSNLTAEFLYNKLFEDSATDDTNSPYALITAIRRSINDSVDFDYHQFFDKAKLQNATTIALATTAAHYVNQLYVVSNRSDAEAVAIYLEKRLHVQNAPLWGMVVGLFILSLSSIFLAFYNVPSEMPHRPSTKATLAAILASSPKMVEVLAGSGHLTKRKLNAELAHSSFRAMPREDNFSIEPNPVEGIFSEQPNAAPGQGQAWRPFAARKHAITLTVILPVAAILTLEIIYRISVRDKGIATIQEQDALMLYFIPFVAPVIMTIVGTMFNLLDFLVAVMAPFQALKGATRSAGRMLFADLLGYSPPIALQQSIRRRHWGSVLSNLAALIGPILTIVASGLLVIEAVTFTTDIEASRTSLWDWDWKNSSVSDNQAGERYERIRLNTSAPAQYVWHDVVLPELSAPTILNKGLNASLTAVNATTLDMNMTATALRPRLVCDLVPDKYNSYIYNETTGDYNVSTSAPLPDGCHGGADADRNYVNWTTQYYLSYDNRSSIDGRMYDIHLGPWNKSNPLYLEYGEGDQTTYQPDNAAGCPSIGIHFGTLTLWKNETNMITTLLCYQKVQEIQATIGMNNSISVDESTAKFLTNGTAGKDSFGYRVQKHYSLLYESLGNFSYFDLASDRFFGVLNGSYPDPSSLVGPANVSSFKDAMQIFYSAYATNMIDRNFRKPRDKLSVAAQLANQSDTVHGRMTLSVSRLKVDNNSKVILQALLATMTVLGVAAYCLVEIRGVLPRNPCSIASTMSFFAGSSMCDRDFMPIGAEYMSEKELRSLYGNHNFSLGWWSVVQPRPTSVGTVEDEQHEEQKYGMRFGIDKGRAILLGFSQKERWYARRWKAFSRKKMEESEAFTTGHDRGGSVSGSGLLTSRGTS